MQKLHDYTVSYYKQIKLKTFVWTFLKTCRQTSAPLFDIQTQTLSLPDNHQPLGYMERDNKAKCLLFQTSYYLSLNTYKGKQGTRIGAIVKVFAMYLTFLLCFRRNYAVFLYFIAGKR